MVFNHPILSIKVKMNLDKFSINIISQYKCIIFQAYLIFEIVSNEIFISLYIKL